MSDLVTPPIDAFGDELLTIEAEECAEIIVEICKVKRFGADKLWNGMTARQRLARELGDLICVVDQLADYAFIDLELVGEARIEKLDKLVRWMSNPPDVL